MFRPYYLSSCNSAWHHDVNNWVYCSVRHWIHISMTGFHQWTTTLWMLKQIHKGYGYVYLALWMKCLSIHCARGNLQIFQERKCSQNFRRDTKECGNKMDWACIFAEVISFLEYHPYKGERGKQTRIALGVFLFCVPVSQLCPPSQVVHHD